MNVDRLLTSPTPAPPPVTFSFGGQTRWSRQANLTDDWVRMSDYADADSSNAIVTRQRPTREINLVVDTREQVDRLLPAVEACLKLMQLQPGWDSYRARAPRMDLIEAGLHLLARLVCAGADAPAVVPTNRGGVQFEWRRAGREMEIEVLGPNRFETIYEDESTGDLYEGQVIGDIGPILDQVAKLIRPR